MTPDIQKRWVAALRSGKVAQARGEMIGPPDIGPNGTLPCRCAMGVLLVDVLGVPESEVFEGLTYRLGEQLSSEQAQFVADWNDDEMMSFDEIADRIERGGLDE